MNTSTPRSLVFADPHTAHVHKYTAGIVDRFLDRARGMRETERVAESAVSLCAGLDVKPAIRPSCMTERDTATETLTSDPTAAHTSLRHWLDVVEGEPLSVYADPVLMGLWDDQDVDSAADLLSRPAYVAHALALAAVQPKPRPSKKDIQRLKTMMMAGGSRDWRDLASALVDSYIASEYEPMSQYATVSDEVRSAAQAGHVIARSRFEDLLARAAQMRDVPTHRVLDHLVNGAAVIIHGESSDHDEASLTTDDSLAEAA